jgi:hypothetical protein
VGRAPQSRRGRWFARPILKTPFIAKPSPTRHLCRRREIAPRAPHARAHRHRTRHLQSRRLAYPQATRLEPALQPRAAGATPGYERETPGEIIHIDVNKLDRFDSVDPRITGRPTGHAGALQITRPHHSTNGIEPPHWIDRITR